MEALLDFGWLQERQSFGERGRLGVGQERSGDRLEIVHAFRRLDWDPGENAFAPWLLAESLRKLRRELFQFVDVARQADEREGQVAHLNEIAVVNLQAFDRFETAREQI